MKEFQSKHKNISLVDVKVNEVFWGNKKYALTLGIKAAKNDFLVFTDADLDGSMSYLLLNWCTNTTIPYKVTTVTKFHDDFVAWSKKNDITTYNKIIILRVMGHIWLTS